MRSKANFYKEHQMDNKDKSDIILERLDELTRQVALIQSILLELTRPLGREQGKNTDIRTTDAVMDGCEDQTREPSGDGGEDEFEADRDSTPRPVRAKPNKGQ
jgi:hypothetical protein